MRNVIFDPSNEFLTALANQMKGDDSVIALVPPVNVTTYAPSKKGKNKGYFRLKVEFWIPEDAIVGEGALTDFGISALTRIPKDRVADHLKKEG